MSTVTPWGPAQQADKLATGIVWYRTPHQDGVHLTARRVLDLPPALQPVLQALRTRHGDAWFRAGDEAALVMVGFPDFFPAREVAAARQTVRSLYPDEWTRWTGEPVREAQSVVLRARQFQALARQRPVACAVWGDWAEHVPEGMVGVFARVGGRQGSDVAGSCWLVPAQEYAQRHHDPLGAFGFLIDPDRHQRVRVSFGAAKQKTRTVQQMLQAVAQLAWQPTRPAHLSGAG